MIPRLDDWLLGALSPDEAEAFERELFEKAARGELPPEVRFFDRAWVAGYLLFRGLTFEPGVSRADVPRIEALGRSISWLDVAAGTLRVDPRSDVCILRIPVAASDAERIDLVTVFEGTEVSALLDLPVHAGEALFCCEGDRMRAGIGVHALLRVYARDGATRRLLQEFSVDVVAAD